MSDWIKRNFGATVCDIDGEPIRLGLTTEQMVKIIDALPDDVKTPVFDALREGQDKLQPLTLAKAAVTSLTNAYEDERTLDQSTRMKRWNLARRVNKEGMAKITTAERDDIKKLIYKNYSGSTVAPWCDVLLEGGDPAQPIGDADGDDA